MKLETARVPWWIILIPLAVLITALFFIIRYYGADAMDGASQLALLFAAGTAAVIAKVFYGVSWKTIEDAVLENFHVMGTSILILLLIGAVSGSWMASGVVPTMMYYGLKALSPSVFLLAVCVICSLVSLVTGSSWTTIATIGVAFIGIGQALGYSAGWTAGAIISGAYFGDKVSPLSDTTVLASATTQTPLFTHIRYLMITTVPSITVACVIFLVASLTHSRPDSVDVSSFSTALSGAYCLSPWLLLVPVATGVLIALKMPALPTLFFAALFAGVAAMVAQPEIIASAGGGETLDFRSGFKGVMTMYYGDTSVVTGNETLDQLVQTHGMKGMLNTIFLILCAAAFGACLTGSGMVRSMTDALSAHIEKRTSLVASTVGTGIFADAVTGDQYLSIILTCSLYRNLYEKKGFESRLLSRSTEDSATVTSVLIPWNSCGMTQSTVLKTPTLEYLPYCFFNILSPLMSIFIAAIGYKIYKLSGGFIESQSDGRRES